MLNFICFKTWFPYSRCGSLAVVGGRYEFEMTFNDHMETNLQFCKYRQRLSTTVNDWVVRVEQRPLHETQPLLATHNVYMETRLNAKALNANENIDENIVSTHGLFTWSGLAR